VPEPDRYDVVVVGAGPAGSSAAREAAAAGARTLLIDRARFPRYKTCGGGLVGASLRELPPEVRRVVREEVTEVAVTRRGRSEVVLRSRRPLLGMVDRRELDDALVRVAVAAGAVFVDGVGVRDVAPDVDGGGWAVRLTDDRVVPARAVVGADGSASRIAPLVGVRIARVDLGLEDERMPGATSTTRVALDWGAGAGSYAWVFPKGDRVAVGVIERRGRGEATRGYLGAWRRRTALDEAPAVESSGHLTRWREPGSPVHRGGLLVAGDAAGLLEPWMREGISFALRSGAWAGAAAAGVAAGDAAAADRYAERIAAELEPEQRAGAALLRAFERAPGLVHAALRLSPAARRAFARFCRGELALHEIAARRPVRAALRLLG